MKKSLLQAKSKFILNSVILYIVFVFISLLFATRFNNVYQDVKNSFLKENTPYLVLKSDGYFSYNDALNEFDQVTLKCATVIYDVSNDQEYKVPYNKSNYSSTTKNKVYDLHYPKLMSTNSEIVENHKLLFGEKPNKIDEVLITKYTFDLLCTYGYEFSDSESLIKIDGETLKYNPTQIFNMPFSYSNRIGATLKVSGIIDIPYNENYKDILFEHINSNRNDTKNNYYISQIYREFWSEVDDLHSSLIVTDDYLKTEFLGANQTYSKGINLVEDKICRNLLINTSKLGDRKKEIIDNYFINSSKDGFYLNNRFKEEYYTNEEERLIVLSWYYLGFAIFFFIVLILVNLYSMVKIIKRDKTHNNELVKDIKMRKVTSLHLIKSISMDVIIFASVLLICFIHNYFILSPYAGELTIRISLSYIYYVSMLIIFISYLVFKYLIYLRLNRSISYYK